MVAHSLPRTVRHRLSSKSPVYVFSYYFNKTSHIDKLTGPTRVRFHPRRWLQDLRDQCGDQLDASPRRAHDQGRQSDLLRWSFVSRPAR